MKITILDFVKAYVNGRISAEVFSVAYIELYRIERDNDIILSYEEGISSCLSSIFCLSDLYSPDLDREEYELNHEQLLVQVKDEIDKLR